MTWVVSPRKLALGAVFVAASWSAPIRGEAAPIPDRSVRPDSARVDSSDVSIQAGDPLPFAAWGDTLFEIPEIRVTASRPKTQAPSSRTLSRLDRDRLTSFGASRAGEALASVPGLDMVRTGPWSSRVSIRGLTGDRILLQLDGVPMNQPRGHGADPSQLSGHELQAVEVESGSSSARNGASALGGVVNLITREPLLGVDDAWQVDMMGRVSAPGGGRSGSVRLRRTGERAGFEVRGGAGGLRELTTPEGPISNSQYRDDFLNARGAVRVGETTLDLEHRFSSAHNVGLPVFNSTAGARGVYPLRGQSLTRFEIAGTRIGNGAELRLLLHDQQFDTDFDEVTVDTVFVRRRPTATVHRLTSDRVDSRQTGLRSELRFRGSGQIRLTGDIRHESTQGPQFISSVTIGRGGDTTSVALDEGTTVPRSGRTTAGAALDSRWDVDQFMVDLACRYDNVRAQADSLPDRQIQAEDRTDEHVSAEAGFSRSYGAFQLYGSFAGGFRTATLDERYYNGYLHGSLFLFGNPDLVPESSRSIELGCRFQGEKGPLESMRFSVYRSDVDDFITFQYQGQLYLVPRFRYVNVARARLAGFEIQSSFRWKQPRHEPRLRLDIGWPQGWDRDTGVHLPTIGPPRVIVEAGVSSLPGGVALAGRVRWDGSLDLEPDNLDRPSVWTGALEARGRIGSLDLSLAIENLWNEPYTESLSSLPAAGRTVSLAVSQRFHWN